MAFKTGSCFILSALILSGCFGRPTIDIQFENQSTEDTQNTIVRFTKSECGVGVLGRGATAGVGDFSGVIEGNAEVHRDVKGVHKIDKLDLNGVIEKGKDGTLKFIITDQGVSVKFARSIVR